MTVGFKPKPTFEDLAGLAKKTHPIDVRGLRRDYFWDSPEAAWLRGPIDEVQQRAVESLRTEANWARTGRWSATCTPCTAAG